MQVEPFFLRLQTEAQTPKLLPAGCTIKLGNKAAGHSVLDSGMIVEVVPPADLRAPASIEETKVLSWCLWHFCLLRCDCVTRHMVKV